MARNPNASKSIVKLQAWVRGYLVRKKFTQLKSEYTDIVKDLEGTELKVCWKNNKILCLPAVFHGCLETTERCDVLSENERQKPCNELLDDSNTKEKSQIQTSLNEMYNNNTTGNDSIERQNLVTDCDRKNSITSKDYIKHSSFHVMPTSDFTNGNDDKSSAIKNLEIPPEGSTEDTKTEKKQHIDITDKINTNEPVEGQVCPSHHTSYPKDELSLQKLHEDLTMELLWIEQAIESRINYLAMKRKMDNQLNDN